MATRMKIDPHTLGQRILDLLRSRAQWDRGRIAFSFGDIALTLFGRFPVDGKPTKHEITSALRRIGRGRVKVIAGKVVYR